MLRRLDVLYAVTASTTAEAFLRGQMRAMAAHRRVGLVVGDAIPEALALREGADAFTIGLPRNPAPLSDLLGFLKLLRLLTITRPRLVVFGTPKMGLLAACATWLCRTRHRVYVVHGLRWEGLTGYKQWLLQRLDALSCILATDVVAVSPSVRQRVIDDMGIDTSKVHVLHHGSANGVDSRRFVPLPKQETRLSLGLPSDSILYAFVGRLTKDKGIRELPAVWTGICERVPSAHLVIVGQPEPVGVEDERAIERLTALASVSVCPATNEIERYLGASDVHLSLSRREGMPTVVLEASSCGVPTVAYRVTGVIDAVTPETGSLVPVGSVAEFTAHAVRYGLDDQVRSATGIAARQHIQRDFAPSDVWNAWCEFLVPKGERS